MSKKIHGLIAAPFTPLNQNGEVVLEAIKPYYEFLKRNKNSAQEILFERRSSKTGVYSAITRNYIKVYIKDDRDDLRNTLKTVNLSEFKKLY